MDGLFPSRGQLQFLDAQLYIDRALPIFLTNRPPGYATLPWRRLQIFVATCAAKFLIGFLFSMAAQVNECIMA